MAMMSSKQKRKTDLEAFLGREDLTMEELVAGAHHLLTQLAPRQSRYKVTERPDVRTIRYYISQNLLPRPASYEGGRARYSGSHLIRLLFIKKLQAEHHTLQRISRLLEGATDEQVLRDLQPERSVPQSQLPSPASLETSVLHRFSLPHGGSIDVPEETLRSAERRRELAESLEKLATSLRLKNIESAGDGQEEGGNQ